MSKAVTKSQANKVAGLITGSPERIAPHLDVSETDLPEIKDWSVGKKYPVTMEIEMVSQRKGESYDSEPSKVKAGFKVLSIKSGGK